MFVEVAAFYSVIGCMLSLLNCVFEGGACEGGGGYWAIGATGRFSEECVVMCSTVLYRVFPVWRVV